MDVSGLEIVKSPGFAPFTVEEISAMPIQALMEHRLTHIMYGDKHPDIPALTFKFSDNSLSPPKDTYTTDHNCEVLIPPDKHIGKIEFKTYKDGFGYFMPFS